MILTLLYVFSINVFLVLRKCIPKDKNVFVVYQNVKIWMGFQIPVLFYTLRYLMCGHVTACVTKPRNWHAYSLIRLS